MYQNRYRQQRRRRHQSSGSQYLMPFLILLALLLVVMLILNLWGKMTSSVSEGNATVHFYEGNAKLKVWGTEDYFDVDKSTLLKQGDELVLYPGSRAVVEFFDGSLLRIDGNSEVVFDVMRDEESPYIKLSLDDGSFWMNRAFKAESTVSTEMVFSFGDLEIEAAMASIMSIDRGEEDGKIRVFKSFDGGEGAKVSVFADDLETVVDSEEVRIAQEFTINSEILAAYREYMSPTVLGGVADDFEDSTWYEWNLMEDKSPTVFEGGTVVATEDIGLIAVEAEIEDVDSSEAVENDDDVEESGSDEVEEEIDDEENTEVEPEISGDLAVPTISSVSGGTAVNEGGFYVVNSNPATLRGTVSGADRVVVNGYTLQKFQPGDTEWVYYANADFDLMKEGENTFEVYAARGDDLSETLTVKVLYEVSQAPEVVEEVQPEEGEAVNDEEQVVEGEGGF